jgi:hypothetical protein
MYGDLLVQDKPHYLSHVIVVMRAFSVDSPFHARAGGGGDSGTFYFKYLFKDLICFTSKSSYIIFQFKICYLYATLNFHVFQ